MSVTGLCEVCATGSVEHTCDRCGNLVCERHFDERTGLCVECAAEVSGESDPARDPGNVPDSGDVYRF